MFKDQADANDQEPRKPSLKMNDADGRSFRNEFLTLAKRRLDIDIDAYSDIRIIDPFNYLLKETAMRDELVFADDGPDDSPPWIETTGK